MNTTEITLTRIKREISFSKLGFEMNLEIKEFLDKLNYLFNNNIIKEENNGVCDFVIKPTNVPNKYSLFKYNSLTKELKIRYDIVTMLGIRNMEKPQFLDFLWFYFQEFLQKEVLNISNFYSENTYQRNGGF